jgi:hypothetical protein
MREMAIAEMGLESGADRDGVRMSTQYGKCRNGMTGSNLLTHCSGLYERGK